MTSARENFEAVFLDGKSRDNILVSSQLQIGADGEYFNSNTKALYRFYLAGWEHGAAAAASAATPVPLKDEAPEPAPTHDCDSNGPLSDFGEHTCSACGHVWEFPF